MAQILTLDSMKNLTIDEIVNLYQLGYRIEELAIDPVTNFGKVTVYTGYDDTAMSITLSSGHGSRLPATTGGVAYNLVWYNATDYQDPSDDPNKEIVRVTTRSTDTLTITRGQEGTFASTKNASGKTYKMILTPTAKMITDIPTDAQSKVNTHASVTSSVHNFDASGNAPPQAHGSSAHTGTIGAHSALTDGIISGTSYNHSDIAGHINATTNIHGVTNSIVGTGVGVSGQYASSKYTASASVNWNNGNVQSISLANGGNTITFSNGISGGRYLLILISGGTSTTVTWPGSVKWSGGTAPTITASSGKVDIVTFVYDGTSYYGGASLNY